MQTSILGSAFNVRGRALYLLVIIHANGKRPVHQWIYHVPANLTFHKTANHQYQPLTPIQWFPLDVHRRSAPQSRQVGDHRSRGGPRKALFQCGGRCRSFAPSVSDGPLHGDNAGPWAHQLGAQPWASINGGTPKWMENPMKMDDLGGSPILGNHHIAGKNGGHLKEKGRKSSNNRSYLWYVVSLTMGTPYGFGCPNF